MKSNLIPKALNRQKLQIFRSFTFYDLSLVILYFLSTILICYLIPINNNGVKVIIGTVILAFFSLTLFINRSYHLKNYQILGYSINFLLEKNYYSEDNDDKNDTDLLVPYNQIIDNYIETDLLTGGLKWFIGAIEIKGFNISTLSSEEQQLRVSQLQDVFKFLDCQVSLIKIDRAIDYSNHSVELKTIDQQLVNLFEKGNLSEKGLNSRLDQLEGYYENYYSNNNTNEIKTGKRFYLFIYHKDKAELTKIINFAENKLFNAGLRPLTCNKYETINVIKSIFNPQSEDFSNEFIDLHSGDLKKLLKFINIKFYKNYFKINQTFYSINAVYDYPVIPKNGWAAYLANSNSTMIWNISNLDQEEVKNQIHRAIINAETNMLSVKRVVDKSQKNYEIDSLNSLVDKLMTGEEIVKKSNILFLNYGSDLKHLKQNQMRLNQILKENNFVIDELKFRQKTGFSAILPKPTDPLVTNFGREMPTYTLASSFPFLNNELNDDFGLFMGFNITGDMIMFNQFHQDYYRKNFNQLLLGTSGSGKSHTAKKQLNWHLANGRKVIVIDPEREYQDLCRYHDGQWVDVASGIEGNINPLQILSSWDETENTTTVIANHLQTLESWFSIITPDLNASELRYLIQKISELYQKFNISEQQISQLKPTDYPIFTDLLNLLKEEQNLSPEHKKIISIVALEFTGTGKYAPLYNGYSQLELNNNLLTVYDINNLFEKGNNKIIQAQLFLILAYIQSEIKIIYSHENNGIIILIDEAHLIIDKDNPIGLNFIFQMVKRIRKRHGGIILITQNPDDFLGSVEIKKKTMAIVNNTQYTFILNLSPQNLADVKEMFKAYGGLSTEEATYIAKAKRGEALFVVSGFNRHCLQIKISETEKQAFVNHQNDIQN